MRTWHVLGGLLAFFGIFFVGLTLYISTVSEYESEQISRTQSSVKAAKKDNRLLEKSEVTSKTSKVADEPSAMFNDPAIAQAWGLKKADASRAWSVSKGSRDVIVCVIDTGLDINHEDLKANLWVNKGESGKDAKGRDKCSNGIDDDGNGYIDDCHGWNFVSNNNDLTDNHGHGTHIAGIIGAEAGNGRGISGVSPLVSIMAVKYFDPKVPNTDNLKNTVSGIKYCIDNGANIINYSGGGTEFSQEEHDAVAEAARHNILFVAAAGNERSNSDQHRYYPADYGLKNIISVTAIDPATQVLSSSNFGIETVDLAAPGQNILSTLPGNAYGFMTGTSQATAFVSAAAVLVMAQKQAFKADDVKKYILGTGDAIAGLQNKTRTSRQLNLFKALTILDSGVGATGVVAVHEVRVLSDNNAESGERALSDPNAKRPDEGNDVGQVAKFGQSLLKAINTKSKKPEKLGNSKPTGDDVAP